MLWKLKHPRRVREKEREKQKSAGAQIHMNVKGEYLSGIIAESNYCYYIFMFAVMAKRKLCDYFCIQLSVCRSRDAIAGQAFVNTCINLHEM